LRNLALKAFGERLFDPILLRNRIISGGVTTPHHLPAGLAR
jgi:hypothetical protein